METGQLLAFAGSGLDRAQSLRSQPAALTEAWNHGRVLPMWRGRPLVDGDATDTNLAWLEPTSDFVATLTMPVFLGRDAGAPLFAASVPDGFAAPAGKSAFDTQRTPHPMLPPNLAFADLRSIMATLSPRQAELAATARALLEWHRTHGFCAVCGAQSTLSDGGWQRQCPACKTSHFPRTDPVAIMLITHGDRVLLGRSPGWPEGMYSLLAGFVEPGETLEAAVRREVAEEAGIPVGKVRYVASQPWPFPASLMLGCRGEAEDDRITLDPAELEDALWLTRQEVVDAFAGAHPRVRPARRGSIAQFILAEWLADRLR